MLTCMKKIRAKMKQRLRPPGSRINFRVTLCVCFCVLPSLNCTENPNRSETSVTEIHPFEHVIGLFVKFDVCIQILRYIALPGAPYNEKLVLVKNMFFLKTSGLDN